MLLFLQSSHAFYFSRIALVEHLAAIKHKDILLLLYFHPSPSSSPSPIRMFVSITCPNTFGPGALCHRPSVSPRVCTGLEAALPSPGRGLSHNINCDPQRRRLFLQRANPHTSSCGVGMALTFQEEGPSKLRGTGPKPGYVPAGGVLAAIAAPGTVSIMFGTGMSNSVLPPRPDFLSIGKPCT